MNSSDEIANDLATLERRQGLTRRLVHQTGSVFVPSDAKTGLFSVTPEIREIFGLPLGDTAHVDELFAVAHPEDRQRFLEMRQASVQTGEIFDTVVRIIRPGGDIRHIRVIAATESQEGRRQALLVDVTEAVLTAEREERSNVLISLVSDLAQLGGWRRDLLDDHLQTTGNLNKIYEMSSGPFNLDVAMSCYDDCGRADVFAAWDRVIREQIEISGEYEITALNGTKKSISVLQRPVVSKEGKTIATLGAIFDISETVALRHRAEAKAERLQTTFENMPDGFFLFDHDIRFLYANVAGWRLTTGHDRRDENILGKTLWEVRPDLEPQLRQRFETVLQDGEPIFTLAESSTGIRQVSVHRTPEGLWVHARDVTKEIKAQRDLEESEKRHRLALIASRDVIFDWNIEEDVLNWSDAAFGRFGYDPKVFPRTVADWLSIVHPGDRERIERANILSAAPGSQETWTSEYRILRADGSIAHVRDRSITMLDPKGKPVRMIGTMTDLTKHREEEQRLRATIEVASDAIFEFDPKRNLINYSDGFRTTFGHDWVGEQPLPTPWVQAIHADDRDRVLEEFSSFCEGDASQFKSEYRLFKGDGTLAQVRVKARMVRDEDGTLARVIGSLEDVTQQRRTEERAKQTDRLELIGNLTGGVAHDFNNLLMIVLGTAELLLENSQLDAGGRDLAATIIRSAERGAELTAGLLAFARRQPLAPKTLDAGEAVAEIQRMLVRTLPADIGLEVVHHADLWMVEADPAQLNAAIVNLAINARDAMPDGGTLLIDCSNVHLDAASVRDDPDAKPGDFLRIGVSDTGTGMTADVAAKAFDPFFTTKMRGAGTGMGLSTVRGFVQQSGGHIKLSSTPGQGTTASIYLPRSSADRVEPSSEPAVTAVSGLGEHILIVEDNALLLPHIVEMIEGLGYRTSAAIDGQAALAILEATDDIDLLFTDVVMPGGLNGAQLAKLGVAARPGLKVLFTSGYSEDALIQDGRLSPGVALLSKPYRRQALEQKLRHLIDSAE